jgi:hypothetical protein
MGVCGLRMAHGWPTVFWSGPRPTDNRRMEFTNPQLLQYFSRLERVTGIEPALSAWEEFLCPRVLLSCNGIGGLN